MSGVEPGLARAPPGAAVERDPLVGRDPGLGPVGRDLRVRPHRVVHVPVVLHVVRVGAAVAPHVALDPAGRLDVVVAADPADVLLPAADGDEGRAVGVGDDRLRLGQVGDELRVDRDLRRRTRAPRPAGSASLERVAVADPPVVAAVEQPDVADAGVAAGSARRASRRSGRPGDPATSRSGCPRCRGRRGSPSCRR